MMPTMQLIWNDSIRETWDGFEAEQPRLLEQSWAYGQAMQQQGLGVQRARILIGGACVGQAQFITRRLLAYIGLASCSRGPVWSPQIGAEERAAALLALKKAVPLRPLRAVLFSPSAADPGFSPAETGRLSQVITGDSTVLLDLRQDAQSLLAGLQGKWRNRLRQAERLQDTEVFIGQDAERLQGLLAQEALQRRARRFHGLPLEFVQSFVASSPRPEDGYLICEARRQGRAQAAMLFLRHGQTATYHIGWLAAEAKHLSLHNLLLWQGLLALQQAGVRWLDLGGINSEDLGGISRFKLGTGGTALTHPGTYF